MFTAASVLGYGVLGPSLFRDWQPSVGEMVQFLAGCTLPPCVIGAFRFPMSVLEYDRHRQAERNWAQRRWAASFWDVSSVEQDSGEAIPSTDHHTFSSLNGATALPPGFAIRSLLLHVVAFIPPVIWITISFGPIFRIPESRKDQIALALFILQENKKSPFRLPAFIICTGIAFEMLCRIILLGVYLFNLSRAFGWGLGRPPSQVSNSQNSLSRLIVFSAVTAVTITLIMLSTALAVIFIVFMIRSSDDGTPLPLGNALVGIFVLAEFVSWTYGILPAGFVLILYFFRSYGGPDVEIQL